MNNGRHIRVILAFTLCVLIIGFVTAFSISNKIDNSQRSQLIKEAEQASLLVPPNVIASLSANEADLGNPTYGMVKQNLMSFRGFDPSIRFVYVMGYKPDIKKQFFYVDSEPTTSSDYSPPGQIFQDTRQKDIDAYLKAKSYTDGPYSDSWGEWVSGYAPIKNSDGSIVALLGIDIATNVWHQQIGFVRTSIAIISILLVVIFSLIVLFVRRKQVSIENLEKENKTLIHEEGKLREIQTMAHVGRIVIYFPSEMFSFDEQFSKLFSVSEADKVDRKKVLSLVHPDDQDKFNEAIEAIKNSDILYTWLDVRIGNNASGFRNYHIYGNIERNELKAPKRFSGILQDITDIRS